jgi:hypothetical protein
LKKLVGRNGEDALKRLDQHTLDGARMAIAENLKVTQEIEAEVNDGAQNDLIFFIDALLNGTRH